MSEVSEGVGDGVCKLEEFDVAEDVDDVEELENERVLLQRGALLEA